MKRKNLSSVFLLFCALLWANSAFALEVKLRERAALSDEMVRLADVAEIGPASQAAEALGAQIICPAPEPGAKTVLTRSEVKQRLRLVAPNVENLTWSGASRVTAQRQGVLVGPERISRLLEDFLEDKRGFLPDANVQIRSIDYPPPFYLPIGDLECEIIPSDPAILTSRRFTFIFRVDGRVERNLALRAEIEAIAPVAVATGDLSRGTLLGQRDFNMVEMDLSRLRDPSFFAEDLLGKELKRSVRRGKIVSRSDVAEPSLVNRGDLVTIIASRGSLTLTASGLAREDGEKGATIKVRNKSSDKEILCRVIAPGTVSVEF